MIGLLAIAAILAGYDIYEPGTRMLSAASSSPSQKRAGKAQEVGPPTSLRLDTLAESQGSRFEIGGRNIFSMQERKVEHPKLPQPDDPQSSPPIVTQTPPPIPLKFCGFARKFYGPDWICLQDDDEVFVARRGDTIERHYKILEVKEDSAIVEDVLNNNRQQIWRAAR